MPLALALFAALTLAGRWFLPLDETRYLAVAWEMWQRGDWLLPTLNAEPYTQKPLLLFWLILGPWKILGVNAWAPRLLPFLFSFLCLLETRALGRRLFPENWQAADRAPFVLFSFFPWMIFSTLIMFDVLLSFFVLVAMRGLWEQGKSGMARLGIGITGGMLAKGPALLVFVLPATLFWLAARGGQGRLSRLGIFSGFCLAGTFFWLLPGFFFEKGVLGVFWHQGAGRLVDSFAHDEPFWFYLALFPVLALPWSVCPGVYRGLRHLLLSPSLPVFFLGLWILPPFLLLSLASGKQPQYLLPLFPALALLISRSLRSFPFSAVGASFMVFITCLAGVLPMLSSKYDVRPIAQVLRQAEDEGRPIAAVDKYHGQYHFAGRLRRPFAEMGITEATLWIAENEKGVLVSHRKVTGAGKPCLALPFRGKEIYLYARRCGLLGKTPSLMK